MNYPFPKRHLIRSLKIKDITAANLRIRLKLMKIVYEFIVKNQLTQEQAAIILGVSQPRISDIVRGKIDKFTIDHLINMLAKAGLKVSVKVN